MELAVLFVGVFFLIVGALFFWLNNNSPIQTCIPAFALPLGVALILVSLGALLA